MILPEINRDVTLKPYLWCEDIKHIEHKKVKMQVNITIQIHTSIAAAI